MSITITYANQKGGVGKTTTAYATAAGLSRRGYHVLALDLDPQQNMTLNAGAKSEGFPTVYELLTAPQDVKAVDAIQNLKNMDFIASNQDLAVLEATLHEEKKRQDKLRDALESVRDDYNFIIIDAPPSLGMLTVNALTASDYVIVPTYADYFAVAGVKKLGMTIRSVMKYANPNLKLLGILLTQFRPNTVLGRSVKDIIKLYADSLNTSVFETFIRSAIAVPESQVQQMDIFTYAPKSTVAKDYDQYIDELLAKIEREKTNA